MKLEIGLVSLCLVTAVKVEATISDELEEA